MDFRGIITNLLVVGLIIFNILSWIITLQNDNNNAQAITNNTLINQTYGNLEANLSSSQTTFETASGNFQNITPDTQTIIGVDISPILSLTSLGRTMTTGVYNILIGLPMSILGVPPIVAGVITSIFILLILLGIWAILRGFIS